MVHSSSNVKEPVKQGMWGIFEVFADTIVVCTLTAFAVLSSGLVDLNTGATVAEYEGEAISNANMVIIGDMTTNFNETFAGNKIITAYNLKEHQNQKFEGQIRTQFGLLMSLVKRVGWMSPIMYFFCSIGIAIVMNYGNSLIISGDMTAGAFASFITSLLLLYKPTKSLGLTLTSLQNIFVAIARVFELFDLMPEIKNTENPKPFNGLGSGMRFSHVNFEYEEGQPVLKDFSLDVGVNETIALVGNSGGGKSTIVNLIPRFYDINSGAITINGTDLRDFNIADLRNNISFVFQDNYLFTGSIKENI